MKSDLFLHTAVSLAQKAADAVLPIFQKSRIIDRKKDNSLVTDADLLSDDILKNGLRTAFPDHAVLTEESGWLGPRDTRWLWMIDPLDGTKAFAKGIPGFAVMVGLFDRENETPHLGVVIDPLTGVLYEAVRGEGAYKVEKGKKTILKVSSRDQLKEMPVIVSTGFKEEWKQKLTSVLTGAWIPPINSVGVKVTYVVRQEADIYLNHHGVSYWDTCAPQIILEEAGGEFTTWSGKPLTYAFAGEKFSHKTLTVASNGHRHQQIVTLLAENIDSKKEVRDS